MEILEYTFDNLIIGATEEINIDVSQESIEHFARLSGDFSPIHIDESFAKESGFESQVVHGMLLGAFVSRLIGMKLPGKFGVLQKIEDHLAMLGDSKIARRELRKGVKVCLRLLR